MTTAEHDTPFFAIPVNHRGRLGVQLVESGRVIYLTGEVNEHLAHDSHEVDEKRGRVVRGETSTPDRILPSVNLLEASDPNRVHFLRKPFAHLALLRRRRSGGA